MAENNDEAEIPSTEVVAEVNAETDESGLMADAVANHDETAPEALASAAEPAPESVEDAAQGGSSDKKEKQDASPDAAN